MNAYIVTMKHDHGTVRIQTFASSPEVAVEIVCRAETAPPSAVVSVKLARKPVLL